MRKMEKQLRNLFTILLSASIIMAFTNPQLNAQGVSGKQKKQTDIKGIIAQTPPLGYNSFDSYGINIYEEVAMKEIDAFIEKFAPHGYEYFVIDNGWFASPKSERYKGYLMPVADKTSPTEVSVNEYGIPAPSKQFFPNGLKPMIDKLHAKGLKFGVHLMRGIPRIAVEKNLPIRGTNYTAKEIYTTFVDCCWCVFMHGVDMTKPGSQEYYNSVFKQFAEWGIDFVKVDHVTHFPAEIEGYVKAIAQCGRPMILSLSAGGTSNVKYLETYKKTNMVRTTPDIWDEQIAIERSFDSMRKWQGLEQPGFWPDLDMIPFGELCILRRPEIEKKNPNKTLEEFMGKMHHWCKLTEPQKETFITQRAISASPIMIGGSMISMDDHSYKLLTSAEMLACVKNGIHGKLIHLENNVELWSSPIANTERQGFQEYVYKEGWAAFFNRSSQEQTVEIKNRFLNFMSKGTYNLKDIWGNQSVSNYKKGDKLSLKIKGNGVAFLKYKQVQP
jgi:alpha-galactosidase